MKRTIVCGAALLGLAAGALVVWAAGTMSAGVPVTRVEGLLFTHSQTIRAPGVLVLDHPIHLNRGVTLTLIADEIRRTAKSRVEGPGRLVLLPSDEAMQAAPVGDEVVATPDPAATLTRAAAAGSQLRFELAHPGLAVVEVFDAQGRSVRRSDLGALASGAHRLELGGRGLRAGVYLYRVSSASEALTGKVLLTH